MALENNFLAEFPPVSKEEWLQQIAKDLKDRPLEELDWQVENDLKVSPFAHADDFALPPVPLYGEPNNWEICEEVFATDAVAANRQALEALEGGAESLCFYLSTPPDAAFFEQLFDGIHLDFIGLHFAGPGMAQNPGTVLGHLERLSKQKNIQTQRLRGSLGYDPAASAGIVDWRYLVDLARYAGERFPGFKLVTVGLDPTPSPSPTGRGDATTSAFHSTEHATAPLPVGEGLGVGLTRGNLYLQKLTERGLSVAEAAGTIQFSMAVGKSYFLEIAKIRAFKLLWLNVLKGWGAPLRLPVMTVQFQTEAYTDDLYTNMIRATTMAMSAVLGGADRLTVLPYDAGREEQASYSPAFGRHIARNVQHLLKMESFFSETPDPAAGSYYIEQLTQQLAKRAWAAFQQA
ncbi:MAG TPA: methylmalonyl-CoA mutase family protein [Saprospiraceae bacterium]|nr:methylmalonyl-CoA mutase family protein [Saprospiraceae bacterium]